MIKILFLSDTHLGQDYPVRKVKKKKRGQDFFDNFQKVLDQAITEKVDMVLHGGDLFFRARIPFLLIPGNHERSRFPRSPLLNQPGIFVFTYPRKFNFDIRGVKIGVSGFPYHRDNIRDSFSRVIDEVEQDKENSDLKFLLTHHAVEGCSCGPGNYVFRRGEDVIQKKDIPPFYDAVLCGHIHRQQELNIRCGKKEVPVLYCGSTEKTSFAEMGEAKGFYEILIDEQLKRITAFNFVKLPSRQQFDLLLERDFNDATEVERFISDQLSTVEEGSLVRIRLISESVKKHIDLAAIQNKFSERFFLQFSGLNKFRVPKKKKERLKGLFDE